MPQHSVVVVGGGGGGGGGGGDGGFVVAIPRWRWYLCYHGGPY